MRFDTPSVWSLLLSTAVVAATGNEPQIDPSLVPANGHIQVLGSSLHIECDVCQPTVISTIIIHSTIYDVTTVTEHDTTTLVQTQLTTDYETQTVTTTFETSYPVTVTSVVNCTPAGGYGGGYGGPPECETITTTEWQTVTKVESSFITNTRVVPTTIPLTRTRTAIETQTATATATQTVIETDYETRTETDYETITSTVFKPTTTVETQVVTSTYPVTITKDHNVVETVIKTELITSTDTVVTSVAVPTTLTVEHERPVTVERTRAVTLVDHSPVTVQHNNPPVTVPGPGVTVQQDKPVTIQGSPVTVQQEKPVTVVAAPATITVTPVFEVSLCPSPTGSHRPLPTDSDLTFGCKPGYVCTPPKESNCNLFASPPSEDFVCNPCDCIVSPPFTNVTWDSSKTDYYPPSYGYFNLDPEAFGLSHDIFGFSTYTDVHDNCTTTLKTGNWGPQATLSDWPHKPTSTACGCSEHPVDSLHQVHSHDEEKRDLHSFAKRAVTPAVCFDDCNGANLIAQTIGKTDGLCRAGSAFMEAYAGCVQCIQDNSNGAPNLIDEYVNPSLGQYLNFCKGKEASLVPTTSAGPDREVTSSEAVVTSPQEAASSTGFTAIAPTSESASAAASETAVVPVPVPVPTSSEVLSQSQPETSVTSPQPNQETTPATTSTPPATQPNDETTPAVTESGPPGTQPNQESTPVPTTTASEPPGTQPNQDTAPANTSERPGTQPHEDTTPGTPATSPSEPTNTQSNGEATTSEPPGTQPNQDSAPATGSPTDVSGSGSDGQTSNGDTGVATATSSVLEIPTGNPGGANSTNGNPPVVAGASGLSANAFVAAAVAAVLML